MHSTGFQYEEQFNDALNTLFIFYFYTIFNTI